MRWYSIVGLSLLTACGAAEVQSQKLKDGSFSVTCELSMDECIRRVQEECKNQRYRILEGTSETRLRDAPPFERAYHTSRLHLVCTDDGASPLISLGSGTGDATQAAAAKPAVTCSAGETRECVGPAACKGGQACLPDGKGFGPCDCGPVAPAAPSSAQPDVAPTPPTEATPASQTPAPQTP